MTHFLIVAVLAFLCGAMLMGYGAYFTKSEKAKQRCGQAMWVCFYIYMVMAITIVLSLIVSWVCSI